MSIPLKGYF